MKQETGGRVRVHAGVLSGKECRHLEVGAVASWSLMILDRGSHFSMPAFLAGQTVQSCMRIRQPVSSFTMTLAFLSRMPTVTG